MHVLRSLANHKMVVGKLIVLLLALQGTRKCCVEPHMDEDLIVNKLAVLKTTSVSQYKLVDLVVHGRQ